MKLNSVSRFLGSMSAAVSVGALLVMPAMAAEELSQGVLDTSSTFAKVGDVVISQRHYDAVYYESSREKYYHGQPPEAEIAKMQREVGEKLVNDVLLVQEAKRRNIKPDEAAVKRGLDRYERRNENNPQWLQVRDMALPQLTKQLEEETLVKQMEAVARDVGEPTEKQLRQYYADHPDLFTQPEQIRVSRILISVLPGSDQPTWNAAREKVLDITKQVEAGADFGKMAQQYSDDDAAIKEKMGDMGYLHGGMLAEASQSAVDKLKVGEISEPFVTTDGVTIVKLTARDPAALNSFDKVKDRAADLWKREAGEQAFKALLAKLKKDTVITVDESRYVPLAAGDK